MSRRGELPRRSGMLKWFMHRRIDAFQKQFDYDMSYAHEIVDVDPGAIMAVAKVEKMGSYKKDVPRDVYYAAKLVGVMSEDCGPCTQLCVTMALREGVDPRTLASVVAGEDALLSPEVRLGVAFARAALAHGPEADDLRDAIVQRWGRRAVYALAFALTTARIYPTLKYALGYGKACVRVTIGDAAVAVAKPALVHAS